MARTSNGLSGALAALVVAGAALSGCAKAPDGANSAPANAAPANALPGGAATAVATAVPFVGCAADGQAGPVMAPTGQPKTVMMDPAAAGRLAYYASKYAAVLGPRGWHCFGAYGSAGASLYLAPNPIRSGDILSDRWNAGRGPAIEAAFFDGGTSGRFTIAQVIIRVFPSHAAFVRQVASEAGGPPPNYALGPFPGDRTVTKSDTLVEYETPPDTQGLGTTFSRLTANASPIDGAAVLQGATPDLAFLAVRLPAEMQGLSGPIVQQFERDAAAPRP